VREASAELAMGEALQGLARQRLEGLARSELSCLRQKGNNREMISFCTGATQPLVGTYGLRANTSTRTSRSSQFHFEQHLTHSGLRLILVLACGNAQSHRNISWLQVEYYWHYTIWIYIAKFVGNIVNSSGYRVRNALHFFALV